jgi:hypothetical protein
MMSRTIDLDRNDLDKSIDVLTSAAQALHLTRFESLSYHALMFSVDAATAVGAAFILVAIIFNYFLSPSNSDRWEFVGTVFGVIIVCSIFVGLMSLVLSIPLFVRVFRERRRLRKLGLTSLSKSLWMESQRSRWISRVRRFLLTGIGMLIVLFWIWSWVDEVLTKHETPDQQAIMNELIGTVTYALIVSLLFAARYLQNQRERIDLTANAEELTKALQRLRKRAGEAKAVTVPAEILEETAKIESARIATERKDAVLRSIGSAPKEYAVAFDREASEQRGTLGIEDRIELEDVVERLSADPAEPESQTVTPDGQMMRVGRGRTLRTATKSNRVEIDYVIDHGSRRIRITGVRWPKRS